MAELTEAQLDEMLHRAEAATAGPWTAFVFPNPNDEDFIRLGGLDDSEPDLYLRYWLGADQVPVRAADVEFIAAARQDIPLLIEEVRRLRSRLG